MTKARRYRTPVIKRHEKTTLHTHQTSETDFVGSEEGQYAIYSLRYPDTRNVFYIGQAKDFYKRFVQHIQADGTNKDKDAIILDLKQRGLMPIVQVETWCPGKIAADTSEAAFIEYYRAWGHPLVNIILHLCSDAETARKVAEHEQEVVKRYDSFSFFQRLLVAIRPLFIFDKQAREEYCWQMEEDSVILSTLKGNRQCGK